jgi:hypothetical protein
MKQFGAKPFLIALMWIISGTYSIRAQETLNPTSATPSANNLASDDPSIPLSTGDKFTNYLNTTYGPVALMRAGASAGISQARNNPEEWGQGWDAYAARFGSNLGQRAVANSISLGVGILRGEDPRYFASERTSFSTRLGNAVAQTFVTHTNNGTRTVAVGRVAGAFGGGFVSRTWQPEGHGIWWPGIQQGAMSLGSVAVSNIFREFWPDVKKRFRH